MTDVIEIALVGVGGFGSTYIPALLADAARHGCRFVAGVDPYYERAAKFADLQAAGIPLYKSTAELYARHKPNLVVLSTPISLHAVQAVEAMRHGAHVLCEKPIAATPAAAADMKAARDATGRHVAIGYQWSFTPAIRDLKADAMAGAFGRLKRMKAITLWPRDETYYARNDWAGAIKNGRGDWVLDSPVNNAAAHHLHNMLYVAGPAVDRSATPLFVTPELYRANPISNFDTAALRVEIEGGAELLFYVTHAGQKNHHPAFTFEFEHATVTSQDTADSHIIAAFHDGRTKDYGTPNANLRDGKLWQTVDAIRAGVPSVCGIEAALPHCQVVWACHQSAAAIKPFGDRVRIVGEPGHEQNTVPDIDDTLSRCYAENRLPSEAAVPWSARPTRTAVEPV